jgi:cysteine synthase A
MASPGPAQGILETVGDTPVIPLRRVTQAGGAQVLIKIEHRSPTGSAKDRIASQLVAHAEREGALRPGGTVVVGTTGNAGIALALVCALKGYRLVVAMPDSMTLERRSLLRAYGAQVHLTPGAEGLAGATARARALAAELSTAVWLDLRDAGGADGGLRSLAEELIASALSRGTGLDAFVAGVGTGLTLRATGAVLKARFPDVQLVAVEPEGPARGRTFGVPGLEPNAAAGPVPLSRVVRVSAEEAWGMRQRLAREEGLLAGPSTGANVVAALRVAAALGPGQSVYTLSTDTGERYFSAAEPLR